jgi:endonuclease/exonuclease/phosphatase family metal-dependent hydrolase
MKNASVILLLMVGKMIRWPVRVLLVVVGLIVLLVGVLLMMEWRPEPLESTRIEKGARATGGDFSFPLDLVSWNLGYAGLGSRADFFMDGGQQVRARDAKTVKNNLKPMIQWLQKQSADVLLLQEVDFSSSRSYYVDQGLALTRALPEFFSSRALNFNVPFVPYPITKPLGSVESGLLTFSLAVPYEATRHQLPGAYAWPVRVFHLKRCLHEVRFKARNGQDWVILHHHLSAFDQGGRLRQEQMGYLRKLMLKRCAQGYHVVVGGDWNQAFPGVKERQFPASDPTPSWFQQVPDNWTPPGWHWAYDPLVPSLRATNKPFVEGVNFRTIVDGFLVGPEIEILSVKTMDLAFAHSDHHPVKVTLRWKE